MYIKIQDKVLDSRGLVYYPEDVEVIDPRTQQPVMEWRLRVDLPAGSYLFKFSEERARELARYNLANSLPSPVEIA